MLDNMYITIPIHLHIIDSCHIRIDMSGLTFNLKQLHGIGTHADSHLWEHQ